METEIKGYWIGYAYMGYVGKDVVGADENGYMEFSNNKDYEDWVK